MDSYQPINPRLHLLLLTPLKTTLSLHKKQVPKSLSLSELLFRIHPHTIFLAAKPQNPIFFDLCYKTYTTIWHIYMYIYNFA